MRIQKLALLKKEQEELYYFLEAEYPRTLANIEYAKDEDILLINNIIRTYFFANSCIELAEKYYL